MANENPIEVVICLMCMGKNVYFDFPDSTLLRHVDPEKSKTKKLCFKQSHKGLVTKMMKKKICENKKCNCSKTPLWRKGKYICFFLTIVRQYADFSLFLGKKN